MSTERIMDTEKIVNTEKNRAADKTASTGKKRKSFRNVANIALFLLIMFLTFYTVMHGQDWIQIHAALMQLSFPCLLLMILAALFFVCAEGGMIWYLLRAVNPESSGLLCCISYSFIGFFYSGIPPSSTGGQPVQLYYMKKDGNSLADSSVVLMTVGLLFKFVLVIVGAVLFVFWQGPLRQYLQGYFNLYLLGLLLHVILVAALLALMAAPEKMRVLILWVEHVLTRVKILKACDGRKEKINGFIDGYRDAVHFLARQKGRVCVALAVTFLQRCSMFLLTGLVYFGFSQHGTGLATILLLQASVSVAVDMLPLPGAQGITELMYCHTFYQVFSKGYLMPSLYVTRGISFYFLLAVSLLVVAGNHIYRRKY